MKRILLKLSGEALAAGADGIYNHDFVDGVAATVAGLSREGYEIALVIGAGNIWRGRSGGAMDRVDADRMGMLATVINSICMKDAIIRAGVRSCVMTSVDMRPFAEIYSSDKARTALSGGQVVVFAGGLGIPFLSTDTAGAVRAAEIQADAMFMAKNIDYIYTADPNVDKTAVKIERISASEMLAKNLHAIDSTAAAFCMSNGMPIYIFGLKHPEDIASAVRDGKYGTVVTPD